MLFGYVFIKSFFYITVISVAINTNPWIIVIIGFAFYYLLKKVCPLKGANSSSTVTLSKIIYVHCIS